MILISTSIIVLRLPTFLAQSIVINYKLMIHDSLEADNSQIKDASATSDIAARRLRSFECPLIAHWRSWLFVMPTSALRTEQRKRPLETKSGSPMLTAGDENQSQAAVLFPLAGFVMTFRWYLQGIV